MTTHERTGKWTVIPHGGTGFKISEFNGDAKEDAANQRLISAAPDMLNAIRYIVAVWDEVCPKDWREKPDHVSQKMLEALEKATLK